MIQDARAARPGRRLAAYLQSVSQHEHVPMQFAQARVELIQRLRDAGLDPAALDPWETWKVFKHFLRAEVTGGHDAASVQAEFCSPDAPEVARLSFIRQFSERDTDGKDVPFFHVTIDLHYDPAVMPWESDRAIWTHDFPTLEEFASVVEGLAEFQAAMAVRPVSTSVLAEEL